MSDDPRDETPIGFEQHLLQYVRDPTLWPVLAVVVLIAATFGAALLVYSLEQSNLFAMAALSILVVMSAHAVIQDVRAGRFGAGSVIVCVLWLASGGVAAAVMSIGIF